MFDLKPSIRETGKPIEYEFNDSENQVISELSDAMSFVGSALIIFGALSGLVGIWQATRDITGLGGLIQVVLYVIMGVFTRNAAAAFDRIIKTEGDDIANLMSALGQLKSLYSLQRVLLLIAMALVVSAMLTLAVSIGRV